MKIITPARIFVVGAILVFGSFYWNSMLPTEKRLSSDQLSTIYTGLGFVGLVATFWHERDQAAEGDQQHFDLLKEMRRSTHALDAQRKQIIRAAYIVALDTSHDAAGRPPENKLQTELRGKLETAFQQLEKDLQNFDH